MFNLKFQSKVIVITFGYAPLGGAISRLINSVRVM